MAYLNFGTMLTPEQKKAITIILDTCGIKNIKFTRTPAKIAGLPAKGLSYYTSIPCFDAAKQLNLEPEQALYIIILILKYNRGYYVQEQA